MKNTIKKIGILICTAVMVCIASILCSIRVPLEQIDSFSYEYRSPVISLGEFLSEPGTKEQPYVISNKNDMDELSLQVLAGNTFAQKYIVVDSRIAEIQLGDFVPIGSAAKPFAGNFDGFGTNFELNMTNKDEQGNPVNINAGLFGYVKGGIIENLSVSGNISGRSSVGGIIGFLNGGTVRNVYNTAKITAITYAGGIAGTFENGSLTYAYNQGEIISTADSAGGIIGHTYQYIRLSNTKYSTTTLQYCYSSGRVSARTRAGGIIGYLNDQRYSTYTENIRKNIYYDVSVIAMYRQAEGRVKPDYQPSPFPLNTNSQKLNSQTLTQDISAFLGENFSYVEGNLTIGYYPQLGYFKEIKLGTAATQKNIASQNSVALDVSNGLGTEEMPFKLKNRTDLYNLSERVSEGTNFIGHHFKIIGATLINLENFTPIGTSSSRPFYGSFDGSFAEFNLTMQGANYQGMFGYVGEGLIKNLYVSGSVSGSNHVGGVVGYKASGTLQNVYNKAEINGGQYIGGIVGYQFGGTTQHCFNMGELNATISDGGGIIGFLKNGTVQYAYNRGKITALTKAGGIIGQTYQYQRLSNSDTSKYNLENCYSSALVQAKSYAGGVIGYLNPTKYSTTANNIRKNVFYDITETAFYQPDEGYIKAATAHTWGRTSEDLLVHAQSRLGLDSNWTLRPLDNVGGINYYYYPQLNVFAANENSAIESDSWSSTKYIAGDGFGTETSPKLIRTKADMDHLSLMVQADEKNSGDGMYFEVEEGISEIDLGNFMPIGYTRPFKGTFNGNGVNFKLSIDRQTLANVGLFGKLGSGARVHNLSISGYVTGKTNVGAVVGNMSETDVIVTNVYNTAKITAETYAGGIVGLLKNGTVSYAYNRGAIESLANAGGIVGLSYKYKSLSNSDKSDTRLENCYSAGTVSGIARAGGIIGYLNEQRYSTYTANTYTNIYYDITVTANYDLEGYKKPPSELLASDPSRVDSGVMFTAMAGKLGTDTNWTLAPMADGKAYYPQLSYFESNEYNQAIVATSKASVIVDISDGMGTETLPFLLYDRADLEELKQKIASGNNFKGFYFKWAGEPSIILENFTPIGTSSSRPFYGSFDGSFAEFNLTMQGANYQGMFGYVGEGLIKNLYVSGSVSGSNHVGGVVGYKASGTLQNVYNKAEINGGQYIGGIVGYQFGGTTQHCFNMGELNATIGDGGGIIGFLKNGTVQYAYNRGKITALTKAGGIIGQTYQYQRLSNSDTSKYNLENCYSSALVQAKSYAGGVIGHLNPTKYSTTANNIRKNLRFDVTILENFIPTVGWIKPSTTKDGIPKMEMFGSSLQGVMGTTAWEFLSTSGNVAYYPQLYVFANNPNPKIQEDSLFSVTTNPFTGDGTEANPYLITHSLDMVNLSNSINQDYDALGVYYQVAPEISEFDLSDPELGFSAIGGRDTPFKGNFDGRYANFHLFIQGKLEYQGLFGNISKEAQVKNLSVSGNVSTSLVAGGVVGQNFGQVSNVYSTAVVYGGLDTGGVIGINKGSLIGAYSTGAVSSSSGSAGGVVGNNADSGVIQNVYASASVQVKDSMGFFAGGVVGKNAGHSGAIVQNAYYNSTLIDYFSPLSGYKKPAYAIGDGQNQQTVRPLTREAMCILQSFEFDQSQWTQTQSSGMWDFLIQLSVFAGHSNNKIIENSKNSVRLIRFALGEGSADNPYIIRNKEDMKVLSDISKEHSLLGIYFKVADGISTLDLSGSLGFSPVGNSSFPFRGNFDGNNASFKLSLSLTSADYIGLFGRVENSEIKNITVFGQINGRNNSGGIAGYAYNSRLKNVINLATLSGRQHVGGIVGYSSETIIEKSYNTANITASYYYGGGITGLASKAIISNCFNFGPISASRYAGGIAGNAENATQILNVYNRNNVISNSGYAGGITSRLTNSILEYSYSAGIIRASNNVGGLIGIMQGASAVDNSYYDQSIIEADSAAVSQKPYRAVGNIADQTRVYGLGKSYLTGQLLSGFNESIWTCQANTGVDAFYLQLSVFAQSDSQQIQQDSLLSVSSYIFAGNGTENSPYIIVNENDMKILSDLSKQGNSFDGVFFKVRENAAKFDLSIIGLDYSPIGTKSSPFNGYFDGSGVDFVLQLSGENYQGLFGCTGQNAEIYRLSVSGKIQGGNFVGSVVGHNQGLIDTVYSTATINAANYLGGIVGYNSGNINNIYFRGQLSGINQVGGIVGQNYGIISSGYAAARISGAQFVGGVIGYDAQELPSVYLYYDKEVAALSGTGMPSNAVGNLVEYQFVSGLKSVQMQAFPLDAMQFADASQWTARAGQSFEVYYPQLKYFSSHSLEQTRQNSLTSVSALRFKEGDGTAKNPFIVRTAEDMKAISDLVISRNTLKNVCFAVADEVEIIDLDTLDTSFRPIGGSYPFEGSFEGNFTRFILNINANSNYQGLFGFIGANGIVRNLSVEGSVRSGESYAGAVAGRNQGLIENVYNYASVQAYNYYAGGIVGYNQGKISGAFNMGNVSTQRYDSAGGIAGYSTLNSQIINAYNGGEVTARYNAGGIVGFTQGVVENIYSFGAVACSGSNAGGVIGSVDANATYKNGYYDLASIALSKTTLKKATQAVGNKKTGEDFTGLTSSQLGGVFFGGMLFDQDIFQTKTPKDYIVYYPQLKVFSENTMENAAVRKDSLDSVTRLLFMGKGTEEDPYLIVTEGDMKALSILTSNGAETAGKYFKVLERGAEFDLTLPQLYYQPIGSVVHAFLGVFDGNDAKFKLCFNETESYIGLFGNIADNSIVQNLAVTGSVSGGDYTGGVAGKNSGTLDNVANKAIINGGRFSGGVAGYNANNISHSYNMGNVNGQEFVAGITGYNDTGGEIILCFNGGKVESNTDFASGIAAINKGNILSVYNTGDIYAQGEIVSGISAQNDGEISQTYHSGAIIGQKSAGIVAINNGIIKLSYYDIDSIHPRRAEGGKSTVVSAVYGQADTDNVLGKSLPQMTGLYPVGDQYGQMNLDYENYITRAGADFTSFFPELCYFHNSTVDEVRADSLASITSNKLEGKGTKENPYIIYDGFDMMIVGEFVLNGNTFLDKHFKVAQGISQIDLTIPELEYQPIGNNQYNFCGQFDGADSTFIIHFYDTNSDYLGIFHTLGTGSCVQNLVIKGEVTGRSYLGAVAGRNYGKISKVTSEVSIQSFQLGGEQGLGGNSLGGITGVNASTGIIEGSINRGKVSGLGSYSGGIAGENDGTINNSYNKAAINGYSHTGGITGINRGSIKGVYNTSVITSTTIAGGIAGENCGRISTAFNHGSVHIFSEMAGGIAGLQITQGSEIYAVYHSGIVSTDKYQDAAQSQLNNSIVGGIIGKIDGGKIYDAYVSGFVYGGLTLGMIAGQSNGGDITRSYYDIDSLKKHIHPSLNKPQAALGNGQDTQNHKGLYHGQMIGLSSIGSTLRQMNFINKTLFVATPSYESFSFYPQLSVFKDNDSLEVQEDSLISVRSITFMTGEGSQHNPYILYNESDIIALAETVNSGNSYLGVYFKVSDTTHEFNFMDAPEDYYFVAIGNKDCAFEATLDGNSANFRINHTQLTDYQALFGHIGENGEVFALSVEGNISGGNYTGGIVGKNFGYIHQVYNRAQVLGKDYTGGIAGYNGGIINNVYNQGNITGSEFVGGIVGMAENIVEFSYNIGVIYGKKSVGAIGGFLHSDFVKNSYYDFTLLSAYRDANGYIKPRGAVGNNPLDSADVFGLSKQQMIGVDAIGPFAQMNLPTSIWTAFRNTDGVNYPQLEVFSTAANTEIKAASYQSTITTIYTITYIYNGATGDNTAPIAYALDGHHYKLVVPYKFGQVLTGWYYVDNTGNHIQFTNGQGNSILPFDCGQDIQLEAHWEVAWHTVEFIDGFGNIIDSVLIQHGDFVTASSMVPDKPPTFNKVYFFDKWDFDFSQQILQPTKIYAIYTDKDRYYYIAYYDLNGDFFALSDPIEYGTRAVPTKLIPPVIKNYETQKAYVFDGWDFNFDESIYQGKSVYSKTKEVELYYSVSFVDDKGQLIGDVQTIEYADFATPPSDVPLKESDQRYSYHFDGWDKSFDYIDQDLTIQAVYKQTYKLYTVRFLIDDIVISQQQIRFEESALAPDNPIKKAYGDHAYKFIGWIGDHTNITQNTDILAEFEKIDRYYSVTFLDGDGNIFLVQDYIEYLSDSPLPADLPTKTASQRYVYIFDYWDDAYKAIKGDTFVQANFTQTDRTYTVRFLVYGEVFGDSQQILWGEDASLPTSTPKKAPNYYLGVGYMFSGWLGNHTNITSNTDIYAQFEETTQKFIVKFFGYETADTKYPDNLISSQILLYGDSAQVPTPPLPTELREDYEWVFLGWDKPDSEYSFVTKDLEVFGAFENRRKEYTITLINGDMTESVQVFHGLDLTLPTAIKTGNDQIEYIFSNWQCHYPKYC